MRKPPSFFFFFFNDTATTEIYTLSLHDALPISAHRRQLVPQLHVRGPDVVEELDLDDWLRSEEHTSELQSLAYLVCRLLLEKKKIERKRSLMISAIITSSSMLISANASEHGPS